MSIEEIIARLKELEGSVKTSLTPEVKQEISTLYHEVLAKNLRVTQCKDCYHDAVVEMMVYLRKHGDVVHPQKYVLKRGVVLQNGFGSNEFYVRQTLTDEKAEELLRKDATLINKFETYPEDWKTCIITQENSVDEQINTEDKKIGETASKTAKKPSKRRTKKKTEK